MKQNIFQCYKTTKYRKSIFLAIIITVCPAIQAQEIGSFLNRTPDFPKITTPNVASFDKFIDNPVSLYNGSVDVSIPIYTLKDGEIELPVTLRYNTTGIKVAEEASWVGLGWNLNVGGVITQNVVGDYDGNDIYFEELLPKLNISAIYSNYYAPTNYAAWHEDFMSKAYIQSRAGKLNPDVFTFSYPDGAGKFVFDYQTDTIYILNRTDASKIEVAVVQSAEFPKIREFKITTTDGTIHLFRYISKMTSFYQYNTTSNKPVNPTSVSYALYKTIYPNNQEVEYNYYTYHTYVGNYSSSYLKPKENGQLPGDTEENTMLDFVEGNDFYLDNITTTNYIIKFNTIGRNDVFNGQALNTIEIQSKNNTGVNIKEFKFDYSYFTADASTKGWNREEFENFLSIDWQNSYDLNRLKLLDINEKSGSQTNNKYEFFYNETKLPAKSSYAVDYWGNYNGRGGSSYLPDLKRLLWYDVLLNVPNAKTISEIYMSHTNYANRGYDFENCKAGILKKIVYPTGGFTELEYEANTFTNITPLASARQTLPDYGSMTHSLADNNNPADTRSKVFLINNGNITGAIKIVLTKGFHTNWYDFANSYARLTKDGVVYKDYPLGDIAHAYQNVLDGAPASNLNSNYTYTGGDIRMNTSFSLPMGTYTLEVFLPDGLGQQDQYSGSQSGHGCVAAEINYVLPTQNNTIPDYAEGCGLRIKQITKNTGEQTFLTKYEFSNPITHKSSGILHEIIRFVKENSFYLRYLVCFKNPSASGSCYDPTHSTYYFENRNIYEVSSFNRASNPYSAGGGVGYDYVREIKTANNENIGWIQYEFANYESGFSDNSVRIDNPMNGKLKSNKFYNSANSIKKTITNSYTTNTAKKLFGLNSRYLYNTYAGLYGKNSGSIIMLSDPYSDGYGNSTGRTLDRPEEGGTPLFSLLAHQLDIVEILLDSVTTTIDNVTTTEKYNYNSVTLQLKEKKINKSNTTERVAYKYVYPNDLNCGIYASMTEKNMLAPTVEEQLFNGNKYIGGVLTEYKTTDYGWIAPDKKYFSEVSTPLDNAPVYSCNGGVPLAVFPFANVKYEKFDSQNNPAYIVHNDATKIVYLWGYNYQYPIAEIRNATYADVETAVKTEFSVTSIDALSELVTPNETKLKDGSLQKALPNAQVTTYTYKPLVGIETITDPRGVKTTYEYDFFDRLQAIKDENNKTIETYDYHYKN
jgi:YD repeat-containing protein